MKREIIQEIGIAVTGIFRVFVRKTPVSQPTIEDILAFYQEIKRGKYSPTAIQRNRITRSGLEFFARSIAQKVTEFDGILNNIKYGDGDIPPQLGDTDLRGGKIYEVDSFVAQEGGGISVDFLGYISSSSGNDLVIREAGIFWEGEAGWRKELFARCLFSNPWTKTDEQDAMIIYNLSLSAV